MKKFLTLISAFLILFCFNGCMKTHYSENATMFYCFFPEYGLKSKLSYNSDFFALGESKSETIGDYTVSIEQAYYDEDKEMLHFSMMLTAKNTPNNDFFKKYNDVKNSPEINLYCGNKKLKYEYGTRGMTEYMGNSYSFGGWFSCNDNVKNKDIRIVGEFGECTFALQKFSGYDSPEKLGKVIDEGNGTYTLLIEGDYNGKHGIFITAYSDKSIFSDITGLSHGDLSLINTNGTNISCSVEKLNSYVLFAFSNEMQKNDLLKNELNYAYIRSLCFDNDSTGKTTIKISDIKNGMKSINIDLYDDVYLTLYDIEIKPINDEFTVKFKIKPSDNLKLTDPIYTLYINHKNANEEKLNSINGVFSYTTSEQEINIRATVDNIYDTRSGEI